MWLVGFGLAVVGYWRQVGALNAFSLVPQEIGVVHAASCRRARRFSSARALRVKMDLMR
jgi:hypothetical protein